MTKPDAETAPRPKLSEKLNRRRLGKRLLQSEWVQRIGSLLIHGMLSGIWRTNRDNGTSSDWETMLDEAWPAIFTLWHGQHLLIPYGGPRDRKFVTLVSRSTDAEINARVIERAGYDVIRGSGGRDVRLVSEKGGVRALFAMRDALKRGVSVVMIADISKGEARQAGEGIVTLARISGRPIIPVALATSRRIVLEKTWDKTTINLPFGVRSARLAPPIYVSPKADKEEMLEARQRVTAELNRVTHEANTAVGIST
ncbi:MAG: lysophospholipid acyltransferase family protein [Hoeflea sp.]|uniref:lysophospholipid acyltransferase family protein n=1 Tax=Hoeflea sp. TaxID=1940281 RepID=UPI0027316FA3|nr:lysophospholipid acyltransferase family protein [Hoeflea sp.]MDP2119957.1 lysophospholipid acyltransferase family protein [Hoeflea sp.]MDP3525019.1 lysophospholipid acyltransferase family protein [Hoeflea sp.]